MAFFDQLADGLKKVTRDITGKAQDFSEQVKLKSKINETEALVEKTYAEIGRLYAQAHENDEESEFAGQFQAIREAKSSLEQLKEDLRKLRGVTACTVCGHEVGKDVQFCPKCGARIEHPVEPEEPAEEEPAEAEAAAKKICPVCGAELEADAQFCTVCGAELPEANEAEVPEQPAEVSDEDFADED